MRRRCASCAPPAASTEPVPLRLVGPRTRLGLVVALAVLALDQASKLAVLGPLESRGRIEVLPVLDFVLVWNTGISYGLLRSDGAFGRLALIVLAVSATLLVLVWLARETCSYSALGLGLIAGGAVGNAIDRAVHGAVLDFVLLHWKGWEWYVFNVADAAIVAGVGLLLYGSLLRSRPAPA
jgi:signal peptidase II